MSLSSKSSTTRLKVKELTVSFKVYLARTRGFCAGVERAIGVVNRALDKYGTQKVYVLHEVVHNKHVVADLAQRGAHFVEYLEEIPEPNDKVVIFSAHGVGTKTVEAAHALGLIVIDATCPLVNRVHFKVGKASKEDKEVVIIGHDGHQEVVGTVGQYQGESSKVHVILTPEDVNKLALSSNQAIFATQTTLSIDETALTVKALKAKYPFIEGPKQDDTCFATQNRQAAVKILAQECDLVLVAGSKNSSNSKRLSEVASNMGVRSYLIDDCSSITNDMLQGATKIGVTAGASVPEYIVQDILKCLQERGGSEVILTGDEQVHRVFPLPDGLE